MRSYTSGVIVSLLVGAMMLSSAPFTLAVPDEGMFAPGQIAGLPLAKRGLKIKPKDIYDPAGGGLTDAVVRLNAGGGSCTAEFISPEGLILTNHHCGFDALVSASTPERDLIETGFNAGGRSGEIPAANFSVFITERVDDVTAKIKAGTEGLSGQALTAAYNRNIADLQAAEQAKAPAGSLIRIQMVDSGYYFYSYQTRQIRDIRMVYAPPRNIGVFGGDPDNFEWTRHTGDFSILRAYTAPDGTTADYSPSNVPYKSKKFLTLNIGGLKENDFAFVLGFPGGTTRYRESQSIEYARDANFPFLASMFRALADTLRSIGSTDEEKRISLQSNIADFDNERKLFEGGYLRLRRAGVVEARRAEEAKMAAWIAADPGRQKKYGTMLAEIKALSDETNATAKRDVIIRRFPEPNSMTVFGEIVGVAAAVKQGRKLTDAQRTAILPSLQAKLKERDPVFEKEMIRFYLRSLDALPTGQRFAAADKRFNNTKGKERRDLEASFAEQVANGPLAASPEKILDLFSLSWSELQAAHPFVAGLVDERAALQARSAKFAANIDRLRLLYMDALTEMKGGVVYPDANLSLRFTYGNIKGYQSREAEYRSPFTTLKGMIEKNTGEKPFDAPQKLIDLQNTHDFGRFGSNGSVGLNFLSTTDIIGGNSGSPVLNGYGEQIGLVFDGNFEGLGNDFYYDPAVNRTISVDIRYVLFVVEKFSGAGYLLNEMKIVGRKS
jgi:hypothetical protein